MIARPAQDFPRALRFEIPERLLKVKICGFQAQ